MVSQPSSPRQMSQLIKSNNVYNDNQSDFQNDRNLNFKVDLVKMKKGFEGQRANDNQQCKDEPVINSTGLNISLVKGENQTDSKFQLSPVMNSVQKTGSLRSTEVGTAHGSSRNKISKNIIQSAQVTFTKQKLQDKNAYSQADGPNEDAVNENSRPSSQMQRTLSDQKIEDVKSQTNNTTNQ